MKNLLTNLQYYDFFWSNSLLKGLAVFLIATSMKMNSAQADLYCSDYGGGFPVQSLSWFVGDRIAGSPSNAALVKSFFDHFHTRLGFNKELVQCEVDGCRISNELFDKIDVPMQHRMREFEPTTVCTTENNLCTEGICIDSFDEIQSTKYFMKGRTLMFGYIDYPNVEGFSFLSVDDPLTFHEPPEWMLKRWGRALGISENRLIYYTYAITTD